MHLFPELWHFYISPFCETDCAMFSWLFRIVITRWWALWCLGKDFSSWCSKARFDFWDGWKVFFVSYIWAVGRFLIKPFLFWKSPCLLWLGMIGQRFDNLLSRFLCKGYSRHLGKFIIKINLLTYQTKEYLDKKLI